MSLNIDKYYCTLFKMDTKQSRTSSAISNFTISFCSNIRFLVATFDRPLSFSYHISNLRRSALPCLLVLKSISSLSWCLSAESLSLLYCSFIRSLFLYCSFIRSLFLYCSSAWFPYASKAILTGCLSSSPLPRLPPLDISLSSTDLSDPRFLSLISSLLLPL